MHPDKIYQWRGVYTFWDFMGDIGGLTGILSLIGMVFMSFVTTISGSRLKRFLIANIFKFQSDYDKSSEIQFKRRKPAKFRICRYCLFKRNTDMQSMFETAEKRIIRELDVVNFLRH